MRLICVLCRHTQDMAHITTYSCRWKEIIVAGTPLTARQFELRLADRTRASVVVLCVEGDVPAKDRRNVFWSGLSPVTRSNG
jgi:hypothetical protein